MKWYKPRFLDETIIPEMHIHVSTATEPPDFEGLQLDPHYIMHQMKLQKLDVLNLLDLQPSINLALPGRS